MPDFLLQASLRDEPGGLDQAIALVDGSSSCLRVIAATRKAREAGVALGMTKAQAAQLAGIRHRSRTQEDSTHVALLDGARSCSPRVEDTAPDAVVVDLEGLEKLLGPPSRIATRLLRQAEELGLMIHLAIAANPDTAILGARGFRGATMIPPGEEAQKLGELPVSVLDPQPETLDTLHRWGIYRLKELAGLPPLPLSERLGQEGVRLQELARGGHCRSLMIAREAESFEEGWELEDPAATLDELDFVLSSVLLRLAKRLTIRSLATQEMRLRLDLVKGAEPEPSLAMEEQRRETRGERQEARDEKRAMAPDSSLVSRLSPLCYERTLSFPSPLNDARLFFKLWR
ncbi:MAG: DNA polymerase Y family protein, partial [Terriglobia bacterium]